MKKQTKKYEAQALAIAVVIVSVTSIIAMSVFYRSQKDKTLTLEERNSAEALEISDLILDKLTVFPVNRIIELITEMQEEPFDYVTGTTPPLKENYDNFKISTLFSLLDIEADIRNLGICPLEGTKNEYSLTIKEVDEDTYFEVKSGQTWSIPIKDLNIGSNCQLTVYFSIRGTSSAGFLVSKSFAKADSGNSIYKGYEPSDTKSYCFSENSVECIAQDDKFLDNGWQKYNINENSGININLTETDSTGEYKLDEYRVRAVGGTIGIRYKFSSAQCSNGFRMISIRSSANCNNVYRGKEVLIPEKRWHNPLFDYVIFNGEGSL